MFLQYVYRHIILVSAVHQITNNIRQILSNKKFVDIDLSCHNITESDQQARIVLGFKFVFLFLKIWLSFG